ncbi:hypothetical protein DL93DRAFT_2088031 [Clavulina sp. PMI_390]|nr:hypothetical protein DL93DRAFT_2088031 [Clavulina sp. PMI_390]
MPMSDLGPAFNPLFVFTALSMVSGVIGLLVAFTCTGDATQHCQRPSFWKAMAPCVRCLITLGIIYFYKQPAGFWRELAEFLWSWRWKRAARARSESSHSTDPDNHLPEAPVIIEPVPAEEQTRRPESSIYPGTSDDDITSTDNIEYMRRDSLDPRSSLPGTFYIADPYTNMDVEALGTNNAMSSSTLHPPVATSSRSQLITKRASGSSIASSQYHE